MDDNEPVLVVIMRTDLKSMNPGKGMAQSNHAFGALKSAVRACPPIQSLYLEWQKQTPQDYGTVITKGSDVWGIEEVLDRVKRFNLPVLVGWVHDPEYPVDDSVEGHPPVVHLIPLNTCAIVFGTKAAVHDACGRVDLHS